MWRQADSDVSIPVEFMLNGQLAIPDAGSIKLTLRDNAGVVMTGYDRSVQPDVSLSETLINIPAANNVVDSTSEFETRYVVIEYAVGGIPCFKKLNYNLISFVPLTSTPDDVRSALGAEYDELPDSDIDLLKAYIELKTKYGANFTDALVAADLSKISANDAVTVKAALEVFPSLQNRLLSSEKTDASEYTRMKVDLEKLRDDLHQRLNNLLTVVAQSTLTTPAMFLVSSPTDPVTNS